MLTDEQLKEIAARADIGICPIALHEDDFFHCPIPALLAHIEHQRRALEWLAEKTAHACATAVGCPFTEPCPAEGTRCLDIEAEDWLKVSLNATKENASE